MQLAVDWTCSWRSTGPAELRPEPTWLATWLATYWSAWTSWTTSQVLSNQLHEPQYPPQSTFDVPNPECRTNRLKDSSAALHGIPTGLGRVFYNYASSSPVR